MKKEAQAPGYGEEKKEAAAGYGAPPEAAGYGKAAPGYGEPKKEAAPEGDK